MTTLPALRMIPKLLLLIMLFGPLRAAIPDCVVETPTGAYHVLSVSFPVADLDSIQDKNMRRSFESIPSLLLGMRDGVADVPHPVGLRSSAGTLTIADGMLTGTINTVGKIRGGSFSLVLIVSGQVANEQVTGTAEATITSRGVTLTKQATVQGTVLSEATLLGQHSLAAGADWPQFLGPINGGTTGAPTASGLVTSVQDIRPLWRVEANDMGQSTGSISRMMHQWGDANGKRTCSGSSSPILANGRLYCWYYVPSLQTPATPEAIARMLQGNRKGKGGAPEGTTAVPPEAMEKIVPTVDEVMLCTDARTGKTLWRAVIAGRGANFQHHKGGPFNQTPAVGDGRVFAVGMGNRLSAFNAEDGTPLWEVDLGNSTRSLYSASVIVTRTAVIAPKQNHWTGFDPATGQELWRADRVMMNATLALWRTADRDYLLTGTNRRFMHEDAEMRMIDSTNGDTVWTMAERLDSTGRGLGPGGMTVSGNYLIAYLYQSAEGKKDGGDQSIAAWKLTADAAPEQLWKHPLKATEKGPHIGEHVPVVIDGTWVFTGHLRTIELATGRIVDEATGLRPMNGGFMVGIGDLVFARVDGTHGAMYCGVYRVDKDGHISSLIDADSRGWGPTFGGHTSSYHHPQMFPAADGRLFIRQQDGVYCWDLRKRSLPDGPE